MVKKKRTTIEQYEKEKRQKYIQSGSKKNIFLWP